MGGAICPACGSELPTGAKFCGDCGTPVAVRACPSCGTPAADRRFCLECGTEVAATPVQPAPVAAAPVSERRITTVLFGDLVGFTSLSESRDAEDVRELLTRYFDGARVIVGRHGGTIEKFIGDAVMAVWGVPSAHEDDAERAVRAALELVEMARTLTDDGSTEVTMRVGLVTGEVAVTIGATGQGMVAGDAVNTAARVQAAAQPGEVWVDETTKALTSAAIAYEDVGEHDLKGKARPVRLFAVRAVVASVRGVERVDGLEAPVVGRDRELRMLKELFHATEERAEPALVLVDAEAGLGKSRLGWEFEKYIDGLSATVRWHRGRCLAYGDGVSFWALAEAIRGRFDLVERDSADIVEQRLDTGLEQFAKDEDERAWLRPRVGVLLGIGSNATFSRDELYAAWTVLLERIGADRPVVLVIDDAQHADDGLLDFIEHLLSRATFPIFLLLLARPGIVTRRPHVAANRRVTVMHLSPLDPAEMTRLVDGLVAHVPDDIRSILVSRAEGVPLFAVETVRSLIDQDLVVPQEGRYVVAPDVRIDITTLAAPASLQTLIAARLDALSPEERQVVSDASVLGVTFALDDLVALGGDRNVLDDIVSSLVRKEILALETDRFSAERGQLRFVQTVVRQVAYDTLSRRDRRARHLAVAERLLGGTRADDEAVVIAQHLLDAAAMSAVDDRDRDALHRRAGVVLENAARRAQTLGAHEAAMRHYLRAVELADDVRVEAALRLGAARAAQDCGRYDEAIREAILAGERFESLDDPVGAGLAAALHSLAVYQSSGNAAEMVDIARPHWDRLDGRRDADEALLALARSLASAYQDLGERAAARGFTRRMLEIAEARGDIDGVATAIVGMAIDLLNSGAPRLGLMLTTAAAALARDHDRPVLLSRALFNLASGTLARDPVEAVRIGREALATAELAGVVREQDFSRVNLMLGLWVTGQWSELDALIVAPDSLVEEIGQLHLLMRAWLDLAVKGVAQLPPDIELGETRYLAYQAIQHHLLMLQHRKGGDVDAAIRAATTSVALYYEESGIGDDFMHLWPPAVELAIGAKRLDEATLLLGYVEDAPLGLRTAALDAHLRNLRGRLSAARGDDPARVEADLRSAVEMFTAYGSPPLTARAQESFGRWLAEQGRSEDADEFLSAARAGYEALGAHGWLAAMDAQPTLIESTRP